MARKKTATPAPEPEATAAQVQEPAPEPPQAPQEATPEPPQAPQEATPDPEDRPPEEPAPEPEPEPAPAEEAPSFPFKATVCVALAVLRREIPPATADMLKPVATLPQGTTVTITALRDGFARLRNGLWISASHITR